MSEQKEHILRTVESDEGTFALVVVDNGDEYEVYRYARIWGQSPPDIELPSAVGDVSFYEDELKALTLWYLKRRPSLLAEMLSDEQKEALGYAAWCMADHLEDYARANSLKSILSPED